MIDMNPTPEFLAAVEAAKKVMPSTEFETIHGDFREPSIITALRETDASLLYEVILHHSPADADRNALLRRWLSE